MELTKEQSFEMYLDESIHAANYHILRFDTRQEWWCLKCLKPIYISFNQYGKNSIFCDECYSNCHHIQTVAQFHYVRIQKELQLNMLENKIYKTIPFE